MTFTGVTDSRGRRKAEPWRQRGEVEHDVQLELGLLQRRFGIDPTVARGLVSKWVFSLSSRVRAIADRRLECLTAIAGQRFISMHVRRGNKLRELRSAPTTMHYARAAERLAGNAGTPIFVFSTAAWGVIQELDGLAAQLVNRSRLFVPAHLANSNATRSWMLEGARGSRLSTGEQNAIDALSEM